jgi:hypothetical protein
MKGVFQEDPFKMLLFNNATFNSMTANSKKQQEE